MNPFPELDQSVLGKVLDLVLQDGEYKEKVNVSHAALLQAEKRHNHARQDAIARYIREHQIMMPQGREHAEARARIIKEVSERIGITPFDSSTFEVEAPVDSRNLEPEVQLALDAKDFAKLYALEFAKLIPTSEILLQNIAGQWVKYGQGSDPTPLVQSIERYKTGWCTAGTEVARSQLSRGDFYVYYSQDDSGVNSIPRIAIRMEGGKIAEVRGIAPDQNMDPYINPKVREKMREFPDGESYMKKSDDMDYLSAMYNRTLRKDFKTGKITVLSTHLTPEELRFLYEIDSPIEGFGYEKDTRITELRNQRNPDEDILIVFACDERQIAHSVDQINETTKAYVGKLEPGIFARLSDDMEYVYTSFPEGRIRRQSIEIGGKDELMLEDLLKRSGYDIDYILWMLVHDDVKHSLREEDPKQSDWKKWKLKSPEEAKLIRLRVEDLGFPSGATTEQIYARVEELGLELCPPEVGPLLRLQYKDHSTNECPYIGMRPIVELGGRPNIFFMGTGVDGPWLSSDLAGAARGWSASDVFFFRLRKPARRSVENDGERALAA